MKCKRANFAHIVMNNLVYVFGGISGTGEKDRAHRPVICQTATERYDPRADKWEQFEIANAPPLAAFAWTKLGSSSGQILVLGGTDGDLCQETQWVIDFKEQKAEMFPGSLG